MVNKNSQVVCDYTKIIINDGVTIFPGYVEIKGGVLYRYDTNDPMNELAKVRPWILHNRIKYIFKAETELCDNEKLEGKHFMSKVAMNKWLDKE